ncbi:hypothetical protein CRE_19739 [Caenorhabditis remanei]|uniref:Uncharacterized protein n=1 Tax=Caenorhabditis remanei TaxID=31234 RepID=E3MTI9_CAERE|nr:hypothetical protein CRE_19739 [Caenorhabditis remanei]
MPFINVQWLSGQTPGYNYQTTIPDVIFKTNLYCLPLALLFNIFHFKTLIRPNLRSSAIYTFHSFLAVSNFSYILSSWYPTFLHFMRAENEYCYRSYTYSGIQIQLIAGGIRDFSTIFSSWLICYMGLYTCLGRFWNIFKSAKIAFWNSVVVMVLSSFGGITLWSKHEVAEVTTDMDCFSISRTLNPLRYLAIIPDDYLPMYQMILGLIRNVKLVPLYIYPVWLVVLIGFLVVTVVKKERSDQLPSLLLTTCQTIQFLVTYLPEALISYFGSEVARWLPITILFNILLQIILCFVISEKYRDAANFFERMIQIEPVEEINMAVVRTD